MPGHCIAQKALLHGHRPQPNTPPYHFNPCSYHCIFCNIWALATTMASHTPLSQKHSASRQQHRTHSPPPSPTHTETYDPLSTLRLLEAQLQTQRASLTSIMSICTVDGAAESEGLQIAFARCRDAVSRVLYQERVLEETMRRSSRASASSTSASRRQVSERSGCGATDATASAYYYYYSNREREQDQRRGSRVEMSY